MLRGFIVFRATRSSIALTVLITLADKKFVRKRLRPCYQLTKTECLYIATKFNDEARAKLVLRWEELEMADRRRKMGEGFPRKGSFWGLFSCIID